MRVSTKFEKAMSVKSRVGAKPQITAAGVESGAQWVFLSHTRLVPFSHRCLASLRHPYIPFCLAQVDTESHKPKRNWHTKGERMCELLTEGTFSFRVEEERWLQIGAMYDKVWAEESLTKQRSSALECNELRNVFEAWWCAIGGTTSKGISEQLYKQLHSAVWSKVIGIEDSTLGVVLQKAIDRDWIFDSAGSKSVSYGRFMLSMFELADNWVPSSDGIAYATFLETIRKSWAASLHPLKPLNTVDLVEWESVVSNLKSTAVILAIPILKKRRSLRNVIEYTKVDVCVKNSK